MTPPRDTVGRPPRRATREPTQARSRESMARVLDAATEILAEHGWDGFTAAAVSARSGVAVGTIYQRFGDKNGLFAAVHDAHLERLMTRFETDFADDALPGERDARSVVTDSVTALGAIFRDFGKLNGAMVLNSNKVPGLGERGAAAMLRIRERLLELLLPSAITGPHSEPEIAAAVCFRIAFSTYIDFATFVRHPGQGHELSWDRLISEVAEACTSYLFGTSGTGGDHA